MKWWPRLKAWLRASREVLGINRRNLDFVYREFFPGRFDALDDKLRTKEALAGLDVATPRTLVTISGRSGLSQVDGPLSRPGGIAIKPARGAGGRGILVLEPSGAHWSTPSGTPWSRDAILDHCVEILQGLHSLDEEPDAVLVEERVRPAPSDVEVYGAGLADLRVVLERCIPVQAMWRIPTSASDGKANLHQGGIGVGIDIGSGTTISAVCKGRPVQSHPDTGVPLLGRRMPDWDACLEQATLASQCFAEIEYLGVDLVIDADRGPLVLEVNARPGLEIQVANRASQPVQLRTPGSRFERFTFAVGAVLLLVMALAPVGSRRFQERWAAELTERTVSLEGDSTVPASDTGMEWENVENRVSERNDVFASARAAHVAGDTTTAIQLYRKAALDSTVAPFARNNLALFHRARGQTSLAIEELEEALRIYPEYARGHYNLGLVYEDAREFGEALASFRRAIELRPSHARSWAHLGRIHLDREEYPEAVQHFERAVRYDPGSAWNRLNLGHALRGLGRIPEAAEAFEAALRLSPGSSDALYWWGRCEIEAAALADRVPASLSLVRSVVAAELGGRNPRARLRELAGRLDYRTGSFTSAQTTFTDLAGEGHRPSFSIEAAAWSALEAGRWGQVLELLAQLDDADALQELRKFAQMGRRLTGSPEAALEDPVDAPVMDPHPALVRRMADPQLVPASLSLWRAWNEANLSGDAEQASGLMTRLETMFPEFEPVLRIRFDESLRSGDYARAFAYARSLLADDAADEDVRVGLARLAVDAGDATSASEHLEALPAAVRDRPDILLLRARVEHAEGRHDRAVRLLERAVELAPQEFELHFALARALALDGKESRAIERYRSSLAIRPESAAAREGLARALQEIRRYPEAASEWTKILDLDGETTSRLFNLALCLQRAGRNEEALETWDRCMGLGGESNYRVQYNRALALERLGRIEESMAGYRRALEINPGHEASTRRIANLEER